MIRPPPTSTLFPYTTLFRSADEGSVVSNDIKVMLASVNPNDIHRITFKARIVSAVAAGRSEEHTSELQSRFDLVCRLLLEKKNIKYKRYDLSYCTDKHRL